MISFCTSDEVITGFRETSGSTFLWESWDVSGHEVIILCSNSKLSSNLKKVHILKESFKIKLKSFDL